MIYGKTKDLSEIQRRQFIKWISLSGISLVLPLQSCNIESNKNHDIRNIFDLEKLANEILSKGALSYINEGADDLRTVVENVEAYKKIGIRARRFIDVKNVSTNIDLFGQKLDNPIILSPIGFQQFFHSKGEIASAKAAYRKNHTMIVSTLSNFSINKIALESNANLWFQLYPNSNIEVTKKLIVKAENAGCKILVLTADSPVIGNRRNVKTRSSKFSINSIYQKVRNRDVTMGGMGNFEGINEVGSLFDPGMTWEFIDWLRENTNMKIVVKGIVTGEDAILSIDRGIDGIIVSNHGGRQLESNRATIDCLEDVVNAVEGKIPILIDGGIRRGTDIFKALALGAKAICIGRPYIWGLGSFGQKGVELALEILRTELVRDMQLAGTKSIESISRNHILLK